MTTARKKNDKASRLTDLRFLSFFFPPSSALISADRAQPPVGNIAQNSALESGQTLCGLQVIPSSGQKKEPLGSEQLSLLSEPLAATAGETAVQSAPRSGSTCGALPHRHINLTERWHEKQE